jgi:hypothetical protein
MRDKKICSRCQGIHSYPIIYPGVICTVFYQVVWRSERAATSDSQATKLPDKDRNDMNESVVSSRLTWFSYLFSVNSTSGSSPLKRALISRVIQHSHNSCRQSNRLTYHKGFSLRREPLTVRLLVCTGRRGEHKSFFREYEAMQYSIIVVLQLVG